MYINLFQCTNVLIKYDKLNVLEFKLDDKMKGDILKTLSEHKSKYESLDINYFEFFDVGRKTCKNYKISADSLMQLCFQVKVLQFKF